jgi:hypothetical protein
LPAYIKKRSTPFSQFSKGTKLLSGRTFVPVFVKFFTETTFLFFSLLEKLRAAESNKTVEEKLGKHAYIEAAVNNTLTENQLRNFVRNFFSIF